MFECHKSMFLKFEKIHGGGRLYIRPSAIVSVEDLGPDDRDNGVAKIISVIGDVMMSDQVVGSAESIVKQIIDDQEELPSLGLGSPEEELKRREVEAERMGRAIARGAKKGQDEADRESWGSPNG